MTKNRRAFPLIVPSLALSAFSFAVVAPLAWADQANIAAYRPMSPTERGFEIESTRPLPHLAWAASLDVHYAKNPLQAVSSTGDRFDLVGDSWRTEAIIGLGLFDRLELDAALPYVFGQSSEAVPGLARPASRGAGDVRVGLRALLLGRGPLGFRLGAGIVGSVPTGSRGTINDPHPGVEPRLEGSWTGRGLEATVRLGYRYRGALDVYGAKVDPEVTFGAGLEARAGRTTRLVAEAFGATAASGKLGNRELTPVSLLGGVRQQWGRATLGLAAGPGLAAGYGSPLFQALATLGWSSAAPDADHDGIADAADACIYDPEDRDGFEDADGCPEADNDRDGLLDPVDRCPLVAEDQDGFEDGDGCPDPDNDRDGLLDKSDRCPNEPETRNGFQDEDGCPDEAPDRDRDGIPDAADQCPDEPEDKDGFADEDGCPDLDDDRDGVLDAIDKCPRQPETINGNEDDDGCPDAGEAQVRIGAKELEVLKPVFFDLNSARIRTRFQGLLRQVALTLKAHPEVGRCAVEGHTDNTGPERWNDELSLRRAQAVVEFLAEAGVEAKRLTPIGHRHKKPWAANDSEEGRAQNRRVIFHIEGVVTKDPAGTGEMPERQVAPAPVPGQFPSAK